MSSERSLFTGVAWGIALGFLGLLSALHFYYSHADMVGRAQTFAMSVAERALAIQALGVTHPDLTGVFESRLFTIEYLDSRPGLPDREWPHTDEIRGAVYEHLRSLGFPRVDEVRLWYSARRRLPLLVMVLPAQNDRWLRVEASSVESGWGHQASVMAVTALIALGVMFAVLWATRRVTRYLPSFAEAAERLGQELRVEPLPVEGPKEIRRASRAFNEMQQRLVGYMDERGAMLTAFSHDLRTFVTRLGLRTEFIASAEQREKARDDLTALTRILDEALAFARDERSEEGFAQVDVVSMLESLVHDEVDLGHEADFQGPAQAVVRAQPVGLRRAFANVIGNAVQYGSAARVKLAMTDERVIVDVRDQGPGIPVEQRREVLKPYVRLDSSRNRETGGIGLGLAIVRNVVSRHDGTLEFVDEQAGFTVRISLPLTRA